MPPVPFPRANYFIATSRLLPGLDGGYTVAAMRRALDMAEYGGVRAQLLTFDLRIDYPAIREEFIALGLATENTVLRNLCAELRVEPELLRGSRDRPEAADTGLAVVSAELSAAAESDAAGVVWRTTFRAPDGMIRYTEIHDESGAPLLRLPYVSGRADWHRADVVIEVLDADRRVIGRLAGFGELYRTWLDHVVATAAEADTIVVAEARQVGELLADDPDRRYRLVHSVHNAHTLAPHQWDSPMDELWTGWFDRVGDFDGVIWLTDAQRRDAERRFGAGRNWAVVPHPAPPPAPGVADRDPDRIVMVSRLAEQKRVDHAIRAWQRVVAAHPRARLDIYGDGPLSETLENLVAQLQLADSVTLHGYRADAAAKCDTAAALLLTSAFEGQGLVILEAFSRGCPVIAYDVNYGPAEMIAADANGLLVPAGDIEALAATLSGYLGDVDTIARLSAGAYGWAAEHGPVRAMQRLASFLENVLEAEGVRE